MSDYDPRYPTLAMQHSYQNNLDMAYCIYPTVQPVTRQYQQEHHKIVNAKLYLYPSFCHHRIVGPSVQLGEHILPSNKTEWTGVPTVRFVVPIHTAMLKGDPSHPSPGRWDGISLKRDTFGHAIPEVGSACMSGPSQIFWVPWTSFLVPEIGRQYGAFYLSSEEVIRCVETIVVRNSRLSTCKKPFCTFTSTAISDHQSYRPKYVKSPFQTSESAPEAS
jgi:hypothetical protein